jgi:hypothetical protein
VTTQTQLERAIIAYVTGLRSARKRPLKRSEICAWFASQDPKLVNETLDRLVAEGRLKLVEDRG